MPAPLIGMAAKFALKKGATMAARRGATMAAKRGASMAAKSAMRRGAKTAMRRGGRSMMRRGATMARRQGTQMARRGMRYARSPQGQAQLRQMGQQMMAPQQQMYQPQNVNANGNGCPNRCQQVQSYAKGGVVRGAKKGKKVKVLLHKGEKVVAQKNNMKATKAMKKAGMKTRNSGKGAKAMVPRIPMNRLRNMAKGGSVMRTGLYVVRVGQRVIPKNKINAFRKAMKKA